MTKNIILTAIAAVALAGCTQADSIAEGAEQPGTETKAAELNAPQQAYTEANARMHAGMGIIDEDADVAFIQGMIPHHQGAVDMANIVLEHGDDDEAKKLARDIIKAQEIEIAWMKNWLKERGLSEVDPAAVDHSAMGH